MKKVDIPKFFRNLITTPEILLESFFMTYDTSKSQTALYSLYLIAGFFTPTLYTQIGYYMPLRAVREIGRKQFVTWFQFRVQVTSYQD